jgi:EmrB/QacA subfamily drug resistance transporter
LQDVETQARLRRTRITALIVACALFMQNLDSTVIATALPAMAREFGVEPVRMNVALTSYLISLAMFIPASGWMADRFGARHVFRGAIVLFTVGSVLCGRADTLGFLVFSRVLQGLGGAMMVPVGRLLLLRTAPKSEVVAAMAWLTMPALVGPVVGPPLGGFIVTYTTWRWVFDINVPIGILGIILVTLFVKDVPEGTVAKLDGRGLFLTAVTMGGLMIGLETVGRNMLEPWVTQSMLVGGVVGGLLYWRHARNHPAPLLDFSLLRIPTFLVAVVGGTLFRAGVGAVPFLLPLMLQVGFGRSAADSGLITFASSAGALVMKPAAMTALRRFGFHNTLLYNSVISAFMLLICAAFRPTWPAAALYAALLTGGFFRSLQFTAYNSVAYADIPRERMSAATSLYSTIQQVSVTLGVTIGAAVLEISMAANGRFLPGLPDFSAAFIVVGLMAILAAPATFLMPRNAATEMSGHAAGS